MNKMSLNRTTIAAAIQLTTSISEVFKDNVFYLNKDLVLQNKTDLIFSLKNNYNYLI